MGSVAGPSSTISMISWRRPAALDMRGAWVPSGKLPITPARRSATSWRARQGSVPPSKATTTWTTSACTVLTTRLTPGRPPRACSTGWTTVSSSSVAARPGLWMSRLRLGRVRSGKRSRFSVAKLATPAAAHTRARAKTQPLRGSIQSNQRRMRGRCPEGLRSVVMVIPSALALDLEGLQQVGAFTHDGLAGLHALEHHHVGTQLGAPAHGAELGLLPCLHEDAPGAFHLLQGALGKHDGPGHGDMDFQGRAGDRQGPAQQAQPVAQAPGVRGEGRGRALQPGLPALAIPFAHLGDGAGPPVPGRGERQLQPGDGGRGGLEAAQLLARLDPLAELDLVGRD